MNRKQRMMDAYRKIAQKAVDANKEYKLHFLYAASVVALHKHTLRLITKSISNSFRKSI